MGYTVYFTAKKLKENEIPEQFWKDAEEILDKVISKGVILATPGGEEILDSGHKIINYTEPKEDSVPELVFNGYDDPEGEDLSHESFDLRFDGEWNFCKTARKPYDLAVKCILMLADKYGLLQPDNHGVTWSFDGDETDEEYLVAHDLMLDLKLI